MKRLRVAIVGAGELGIQASHYIHLVTSTNCEYIHCGWLDDTLNKDDEIEGIKVIGNTDDIYPLYREQKFDACFIAIGYNHLDFKSKMINRIKGCIPIINIIAPTAYVDKTASLGVNVFLYPGAIVDKRVKLHDGSLLNLGSIVSHDTEIGGCSFLAPNATVAGFSKIGNCTFMGIGSGIIDNIKICDNVRIGAGAMVTKDILIPGLYCGVPAKLKKQF